MFYCSNGALFVFTLGTDAPWWQEKTKRHLSSRKVLYESQQTLLLLPTGTKVQ